uniref:Uncharacterized protein n=1 Tax=Arundo donax TaxID=35708 RepID=A0A0A9HIA9_ARUDO
MIQCLLINHSIPPSMIAIATDHIYIYIYIYITFAAFRIW